MEQNNGTKFSFYKLEIFLIAMRVSGERKWVIGATGGGQYERCNQHGVEGGVL